MKDVILQGDVLEQLRGLPGESVDCIVTSPPYYGLRDYGVARQIGLEKTLAEYLDKMLLITAELKRVLKKTGTMWWNHGDSYSHKQPSGFQGKNGGRADRRFTTHGLPGRADVPEKSLMLQAHRLAIRMVDEQGWILRNQIIWHKPNVMPSSVKDRFTVDFEPIFFFSKSKKYWFEAQYEPHTAGTHARGGIKKGATSDFRETSQATKKGGWNELPPVTNPLGRNKRSVWKISTAPFKEAHFATFPEALLETPIKAGCPEFVCIKCRIPREKIFERRQIAKVASETGYQDEKMNANNLARKRQAYRALGLEGPPSPIFKGYTDCGCKAEFVGGVVLDPFLGAGTTAVVAKRLGRHYIGIELNPEYVKISEARLGHVQLPL